MDLVHSTLQASFNARIERLAEQEASELRTIFRYFDTDGDGAVSADQVLRIFGLLGLIINPAYVRDLEEVYLAEFLKIVDSNVPVVATAASSTPETAATPLIVPVLTMNPSVPVDPAPGDLAIDPEAQARANAQLWEDEWRAIDSYGRGFVSRDELRFFLRSCFSPFSINDLDRLLELYADPSMPEDSMTLTKTAFLKFRFDYTTRERLQSEEHANSSEEDEDGDDEEDISTVDRSGESDNLEAHDAELKTSRAKRSISVPQVREVKEDTDGDVGGIVIDPTVVDDDFVDDDDSTAADQEDTGGGGLGGCDDGILYEEDDEADGSDGDAEDE